MSAGKIVMLVIYAVLAVLALGQGDAAVGVWARWIILVLAVVHAIEVVVYFRLCRQAGGSFALHLLNVFLFGVLHVRELKGSALPHR